MIRLVWLILRWESQFWGLKMVCEQEITNLPGLEWPRSEHSQIRHKTEKISKFVISLCFFPLTSDLTMFWSEYEKKKNTLLSYLFASNLNHRGAFEEICHWNCFEITSSIRQFTFTFTSDNFALLKDLLHLYLFISNWDKYRPCTFWENKNKAGYMAISRS